MMDRLQQVLQAYDLWWERKNTEPLFYVIFPKDDASYEKVAKPWMAPAITRGWSNWQQEMVLGQALELTFQSGEWRYVDEAIDLLEHYATITDHMAEGYSFLLPGLGPGCLAAFITNFCKFTGTTIWFELEEPWEWDRLLKITPDTLSNFGKLAIAGVERLVKRLQDRYVIATPDIGVGMDTLSPIRGAQNLLMDTLDCPDVLQQMRVTLEQLWEKTYRRFSSFIDPGNHGCYAETMRYLSGKPTHISYCDFSAMIGPDMFRDFVLPTIRRECDLFGGRVVYHLDGPGQLPHVKYLCEIPNLFAVQWVSGAGNPDGLSERWFGLYKQLIDAGKRICLGGTPLDPGRIGRLFATFPKTEFFMPFTLKGRKEAETVMRLR